MHIKSGLVFIAFHSNQRRKIPITEVLYSGVGLCHIMIYHVTVEKRLHCSLLWSVVTVVVLSHSLQNEKDICKKATQIKLEHNHETAKDSYSYTAFLGYTVINLIYLYIYVPALVWRCLTSLHRTVVLHYHVVYPCCYLPFSPRSLLFFSVCENLHPFVCMFVCVWACFQHTFFNQPAKLLYFLPVTDCLRLAI